MNMKKLLLASAIAMAPLAAVPAVAQDVDWSITVGSDSNRYDPRYSYPGYGNNYGNYGTQYGATNYCSAYRTPIVLNNLRTGAGSIYVSNNNYNYTTRFLNTSDRFRPASVICVDNREFRGDRTAMIIHDVNNNRVFDRRDGVGYARLSPQQIRSGYYGATIPERVTLRYGRW